MNILLLIVVISGYFFDPERKLREKCHQLNIVTDSISISNGL
jgi:hypothetical protein